MDAFKRRIMLIGVSRALIELLKISRKNKIDIKKKILSNLKK